MSLVNYELAPSSLQDESTRPDIWYILIIPGFGIVSHVISAFAGKPIFGYLGMVCKESSVAPNSQSSGKRSLLNTSADPNWVSGFVDAEGSLTIRILKGASNAVGHSCGLAMNIYVESNRHSVVKRVIGSRQRASKTNPAPSKELNPYWVTVEVRTSFEILLNSEDVHRIQPFFGFEQEQASSTQPDYRSLRAIPTREYETSGLYSV
ncbi:7741_t:CDS:2 [Dentiscutata heterogama]|uniref:7741_t:CDS:1 n=1 Tax=Dentiscutata heterogama TaxID=1316150 RepID=A0ACA9JWT5_9GLOM|nr:7741_t:CDS:2 [Dentiscutata heterogama]